MFLLVSGSHICAPERNTNMASPYKALQIWLKPFPKYLAYDISYRPDSWRYFLYIHLLSFPRLILDFLYQMVCILLLMELCKWKQRIIFSNAKKNTEISLSLPLKGQQLHSSVFCNSKNIKCSVAARSAVDGKFSPFEIMQALISMLLQNSFNFYNKVYCLLFHFYKPWQSFSGNYL